MRYKKIIFILLTLRCFLSFAQTNDKIIANDSLCPKDNKHIYFRSKQLIIPSVLIGYGILGIGNDQIKSYNSHISQVVTENIDRKFTIDDYSQYLPAGSVYALSAMGIKGKNNCIDKTIILATSYLIMGVTVNSLKRISKVERPDHSSFDSFPSGHTATAFMGAEFLFQEYKDVSIWYGISGYFVATGTGALRMINNRHWLTDVVTGAGIGILSTKAAYWLYPTVNKLLASKGKTNKKSAFIPYYDGNQIGFSFVTVF